MMELTIKGINGKTQDVNVLASETVGGLKRQVAPLFDTTASCLKLSASGGQILDNDQKTVSDYGLSSGSTVMLLISTTPVKFQVFVRNLDEQIKTYNITDDETVDQLMRKIYQMEGTPMDQQRLVFKGRHLEPGRKLQDYRIVPDSTIYMIFRMRGG